MLPVIIHIAPVGNEKASGLNTAIPQLAQELHELGIPTGLLTTNGTSRYTGVQSYPVAYFRDRNHTEVSSYFETPLNNPDLVVFHSTYVPVHAKLAAWCIRKQIPYIICPHGGMTHGAQQKNFLKKLLGNILFFDDMVEHSAALHFLTKCEATQSARWDHPFFIVGNGITTPVKRKDLNCSSSNLRFVFIGRFDIYHKGLDLLLDACGLAQHSLRESRVTIHLYGPQNLQEQWKMQRIISERQIGDFVHIESPVYEDDKEAVLLKTDLFVHTSRFEGHPLSVLEALSYGIPCLLTPGTNLAEEVEKSGAGWKVEPTAEAIARGLLNAVTSRLKLVTMGLAARRLIETRYSWDQIGKQTLEQYLYVASSQKES